jgi:pimeloyl-ACP methyl ester carboxylesterase
VKPHLQQALVDGVTIGYLEQGLGTPVVFVHCAVADHRVWEAQREDVSSRYRYIAVDLRYFGAAPWPDDGTNYSLATHAHDLAGFIRQLGAGPVHVVGWSYGGSVALALAVKYPDLVLSLFLNEPALASTVEDLSDKVALAEEAKGIGEVRAALKAGDQAKAVQLVADWVNGQSGSFEALPPATRGVFLENGRTVAPHFMAPPAAITCGQLGQLRGPVTLAKGLHSRPYFNILTDSYHRCIPGSRLIVIPEARHWAPVQNTSAFNAALLDHLEGHSRNV